MKFSVYDLEKNIAVSSKEKFLRQKIKIRGLNDLQDETDQLIQNLLKKDDRIQPNLGKSIEYSDQLLTKIHHENGNNY